MSGSADLSTLSGGAWPHAPMRNAARRKPGFRTLIICLWTPEESKSREGITREPLAKRKKNYLAQFSGLTGPCPCPRGSGRRPPRAIHDNPPKSLFFLSAPRPATVIDFGGQPSQGGPSHFVEHVRPSIEPS